MEDRKWAGRSRYGLMSANCVGYFTIFWSKMTFSIHLRPEKWHGLKQMSSQDSLANQNNHSHWVKIKEHIRSLECKPGGLWLSFGSKTAFCLRPATAPMSRTSLTETSWHNINHSWDPYGGNEMVQ
jgi:hypothetical protein